MNHRTHREALDSLFAAWLRGDALRSAAHFAPEGAYCEARATPIAGREAIAEHFTRFFRDGPAWRFDVDDVVVEGNRAAVRYRFTIDRGVAGETERAGCAFVTFLDGAIIEWREYEG